MKLLKQLSSAILWLISWATESWLAHCTLFSHPWPLHSVELVRWSCIVSKVVKVSD